MRRIASIGECLIELSGYDPASGNMPTDIAGDTFNTAVYLARRLPASDFSVSYMTVIGEDQFSDRMIDRMHSEAIDTRHVGRHPSRLPGIYAIELADDGERSFRYWRDSSAARTLFTEGHPYLDDLDDYEVLFVSSITLAVLPTVARSGLIERCRARKAEGATVVFDSNYRPRLWPDADTAREAMAQMWQAATIALPSRDDEAMLYPQEDVPGLIGRLADAGASEIILKNGADGPIVWRDGLADTGAFPPAPSVIDTTGAGDSFNAGYLAARLTGADPATAARAGHDLACQVVGCSGAILPR